MIPHDRTDLTRTFSALTLSIALLAAPAAPAQAPSSELPPGVSELLRSAVEERALEALWQVGTPLDGVAAAWQMANRARDLRTFLTPRGVRVTPFAGGRWELGLQLAALGRPAAMNEVGIGRLAVDGARAEYRRDGIVEWYVNDTGGLEQGFDLLRRPSGEGPLRLAINMNGGLRAQVASGGARLSLVDACGGEQVSLAGLFSVDRTGRELTTHFAPAPGGFAIVVDDERAEYPITIDPRVINEQAVLSPTGGAPGGLFGHAVAMDAERIVVGAVGASSLGIGQHAGAAYVFFDDPSLGWVLEAKLTDGPLALPDEDYGDAVDIDGTVLVVGVPFDRDMGLAIGKALVYELGAGGWELSTELRPIDVEIGDQYGSAVSVIRRLVDDQPRVAVGAPAGGPADLGIVYLHQSSAAGDWSQTAELRPGGLLGAFGISIDQTQWRVAVGSIAQAHVYAWDFAGNWALEDQMSGGSPTQFGRVVRMPDPGRLFVSDTLAQNTNAVDCGGIYMFTRNGSDWIPSILISPLDGLSGDHFGIDFAVDGDLLVAVADEQAAADTSVLYVWGFQFATWHEVDRFLTPEAVSSVDLVDRRFAVGYTRTDSSLGNEGSVILYEEVGAQWLAGTELEGSDLDPGDAFGQVAALDGDTLVVSAPLDGDSAYEGGAVYVFDRIGANWHLSQKLVPGSAARAQERFGHSLALDGDRLAVGAPGSDEGGAVFIYHRPYATWNEEVRLQVSNQHDRFGNSLALDENRLLISAKDYVPMSGAPGGAFVFEHDGQDWLLAGRLAIAGAAIGTAVALDGDLAVVTDVQFTGTFASQGAAYLFDRTAATWSLLARVDAPEPAPASGFGYDVALGAGRLVVSSPNHGAGRLSVFRPQSGAWLHQTELTPAEPAGLRLGHRLAMEGDRVLSGSVFDDDGYGRGNVHVFREAGSGWYEEARLESSQTVVGDGLGFGLALSGATVVAGAPGTDEGRGAAYVFDLGEPSPFVPYCFGDGSAANDCPCGNAAAPGEGCANSSGTGALLSAAGSPSVAASDLVVTFESDLAGKPALLFAGTNALGGALFGDGLRCAGGPIRRLGVRTTDGTGTVSWGPGITGLFGPTAGQSAYLQAWHRDPQGPCGSGFGLSAGLEVMLEP